VARASPICAYSVHSVVAVRPHACPPTRRRGQWMVASWAVASTPLLTTGTSLCSENERTVCGGVHARRSLLGLSSRTRSSGRQHLVVDVCAPCGARYGRRTAVYDGARGSTWRIDGGSATRRRTSRHLNTLFSVASFLKKHTINPVISYRELMTLTL
jgi:hypothetical protein